MSTVDKDLADNIVKGGGWVDGDSSNELGDNPQVVLIVEYDNAYAGVGYGLVFKGKPNRYTASEFARNPRTYWSVPAPAPAPTPPLVPVEGSTSIAATGYEPATLTLAIQFKGGGVYLYAGVPQQIVDRLRAAESVGKFYMQQIRGKYDGLAQPTTKTTNTAEAGQKETQ